MYGHEDWICWDLTRLVRKKDLRDYLFYVVKNVLKIFTSVFNLFALMNKIVALTLEKSITIL